MCRSEAQAYQAIRRYYKRKRDRAQRDQNEYMWSVNHNGERHPKIVKQIQKIIPNVYLPLSREETSLRQAYKHQVIASECQQFLNRFKVEK